MIAPASPWLSAWSLLSPTHLHGQIHLSENIALMMQSPTQKLSGAALCLFVCRTVYYFGVEVRPANVRPPGCLPSFSAPHQLPQATCPYLKATIFSLQSPVYEPLFCLLLKIILKCRLLHTAFPNSPVTFNIEYVEFI